MPKSHAGMVEHYWEFCRMITHVVDYYVTLDIDLRLIPGGVRTTIALHHGRNKKLAHLHRDAVECRSSECVVVLC